MPRQIDIIVRLQHWMDSVPGQTFLNYAYSWGASIVILGALFKLTHMPGGNLMLFIGMGTEVVVFFLSAFDRPFDKTEIGKELPKTYLTDEEISAKMAAEEAARLGIALPQVDDDEDEDIDDEMDEEEVDEVASPAEVQPAGPAVVSPAAVGGSPTAAVQTAMAAAAAAAANAAAGAGGAASGGAAAAPAAVAAAAQPAEGAPQGAAPASVIPAGVPVDANAQQLADIIRAANDELLHRAQAVLSPEMEEATKVYIEKLRTLTETFAKVDEQSARLTRDSEEMENLNRTLTGINKVYELHLKSISLQVGTIDEINNQTHKLADQIQRLNEVYGRMIEALTVNMARGGANMGE